jgi:hypothetical protein
LHATKNARLIQVIRTLAAWCKAAYLCRVGRNHTYIPIYNVNAVFSTGKFPYMRSYTMYIYGSGQP